MGIECAYSFEDLYKAAYGKKLPVKKKKELQSTSQEDINNLVYKWAQKADWRTSGKNGSDGNIYLSFYP